MNKILFVVTALETGGIERYLLRLVRYIKSHHPQIAIDVLCKGGRIGALEAEFRQTGANIIVHHSTYIGLRDKHKLKQIIAQGGYTATLDFTGDFAGFTMLYAHKANIPRRVAYYRGSCHHHKTDFLRMLYYKFVRKLTTNHATNILANSKIGMDFFRPGWRDDKSDKYEVIYNGVPSELYNKSIDKKALRESLGISPNQKIVGHVGRFNEAKNHEAIMAAAEIVCKKRDDVRFLLCGRDVQQGLAKEIQARNLTDKIITPGDRSDIPSLLQIMDVFYFPSRHEGQPNAFLEAIISRLPFVASNIGSITESIPPEYFNWLTEPSDYQKSAELILKHLDETTEYIPQAESLSMWAKNKYSTKKCFEQLLKYLI